MPRCSPWGATAAAGLPPPPSTSCGSAACCPSSGGSCSNRPVHSPLHTQPPGGPSHHLTCPTRPTAALDAAANRFPVRCAPAAQRSARLNPHYQWYAAENCLSHRPRCEKRAGDGSRRQRWARTRRAGTTGRPGATSSQESAAPMPCPASDILYFLFMVFSSADICDCTFLAGVPNGRLASRDQTSWLS